MEVRDAKKLDFSIYTKEEKVEPKTLEECLKEAGGFPFSAKVIVPGPSPESWPKDISITLIRGDLDSYQRPVYVATIHNPNYPRNNYALIDIPRWQLLGHK